MIRTFALLPLVGLCWLGVIVGVARFTDEAPAYIIPYPTRDFVRALPDDARVANYRPHGITVTSDAPGFAARLYAAGAVLVLPAGLPGCAPFTRETPTRS